MDASSATGSPTSNLKSEREEAASLDVDPKEWLSKFDELLLASQLYSEFILEKIEQITDEYFETEDEEELAEEKQERDRKRKAISKPQCNDKKANTAMTAMLTRSGEDCVAADGTPVEEKRCEQEQANLIPLMTGGKLKSYQIKGVKWLIALWQNGLNGILADEMGLGKTLQTIGFLAHLKGNGLHGPYMIIAALSTLSNWVNEISRFVPSMTGLIYHGDRVVRSEIRRKFMPKSVGPDFPIIVTSYEMAMSDAKFLSNYKWKSVVVDEGHPLRNSTCEVLRGLERLPIDNKLILTAKPLQNNLAELWSLLNFIVSNDTFRQEFESGFDFSGKGGEEHQEQAEVKICKAFVVSKLHAILHPFILRQTKENIENQNQLQTHLVDKTFNSYLHEKPEVASECDAEGTPCLRSTRLGLESNKVKRPRPNNSPLSLLKENSSSFKASIKSAELVQVPKATFPEEIIDALKEVAGLARADFLRAYSILIRDDLLFQSLMALPVDMRKVSHGDLEKVRIALLIK